MEKIIALAQVSFKANIPEWFYTLEGNEKDKEHILKLAVFGKSMRIDELMEKVDEIESLVPEPNDNKILVKLIQEIEIINTKIHIDGKELFINNELLDT